MTTNTITVRELINTPPIIILAVEIFGDGSSSDYSAQLVNAVTGDLGLRPILWRVQSSTNNGCSAVLSWDATTPVEFLTIPPNIGYELDYSRFGGLSNNAGTGKTGDIKIKTLGLNGNSTAGHISLIIELRRYV